MDYLHYKTAAQSHMKTADHLLTMTYPIVNDPKLLKLILHDIHLSLENAVSALLVFKKKKTQSLHLDIDSLRPILNDLGISTGYIGFLTEFDELVSKQREAGVEFIRKEKFVFASPEYKLDTVTEKDLKDIIMKGKLFLKEVMEVVE